MSDQWASVPAGLGFAGESKRDRSILEHNGVGPWNGKVMITPVLDVGGEPVLYEIHASWLGPGLAIPGALGEDPRPTLANDVVYVTDQALARTIADLAVIALRAPNRPDLPGFHRDLLSAK